MKTLVLSCSTGGGHNACGHYIEEEFKRNNIACDFVDYFEIFDPKAKEQAEKIYLKTTKGNGSPFWEETEPDYFVIPHSTLKKEFINKGFKKEILLDYGISVSSSFSQIKNNLDLPTDKDIVLITSGSMGFGKMKEIIEALLKNIPNIYVVAICGNNKKLYSELQDISNPNLIVRGYVNNINEYISASSIVLTKPGGLTSTEVGIIRKPMIHLMPIPGVENYNAEFFRKNGLSLVSNDVEEVIANTKKLLEDKNMQQMMIEKQSEFINRNSAKDLVEFVLKSRKTGE